MQQNSKNSSETGTAEACRREQRTEPRSAPSVGRPRQRREAGNVCSLARWPAGRVGAAGRDNAALDGATGADTTVETVAVDGQFYTIFGYPPPTFLCFTFS